MNKLLKVFGMLFGLGAIGVFFGFIFGTGGNPGGFLTGIIVGAILLFISLRLFRKSVYYCSKCGVELRSTGRYRETGDIYSHEDGNRTVVTERVEVEYECPICHHTKVISEKHKIGSF